jgi:hypothetical protein
MSTFHVTILDPRNKDIAERILNGYKSNDADLIKIVSSINETYNNELKTFVNKSEQTSVNTQRKINKILADLCYYSQLVKYFDDSVVEEYVVKTQATPKINHDTEMTAVLNWTDYKRSLSSKSSELSECKPTRHGTEHELSCGCIWCMHEISEAYK